MSSNLHPIMAQALAPWMPPADPVPTMAEQLADEYRSGLDQTGPGWKQEEDYWRDEMLQGDD